VNYLKIALAFFSLFLVLSVQAPRDTGLVLAQLEDNLFLLVNNERTSQGLPELHYDPRLSAMAREHSKKMLHENQLADDFPGYIWKIGKISSVLLASWIVGHSDFFEFCF
jgi:hypothetical protein